MLNSFNCWKSSCYFFSAHQWNGPCTNFVQFQIFDSIIFCFSEWFQIFHWMISDFFFWFFYFRFQWMISDFLLNDFRFFFLIFDFRFQWMISDFFFFRFLISDFSEWFQIFDSIIFYFRFFNRRASIFCEFVPQVIFMCSLFVYLVLLVFIKWINYGAGKLIISSSFFHKFITLLIVLSCTLLTLYDLNLFLEIFEI